MSIVVDAGALLAVERGDREMVAIIKSERIAGRAPLTHGGIIGQVWRGRGPRQALLVKALAAVDVRPLDERLGRAAGELLAAAKRRDAFDAALVVLAADGDYLITSDPDDIEPLARASGCHVEIVRA